MQNIIYALIYQSIAKNFTLNIAPCSAGFELMYDPKLDGFTCQCFGDKMCIHRCADDQRTILLAVRLSCYCNVCYMSELCRMDDGGLINVTQTKMTIQWFIHALQDTVDAFKTYVVLMMEFVAMHILMTNLINSVTVIGKVNSVVIVQHEI